MHAQQPARRRRGHELHAGLLRRGDAPLQFLDRVHDQRAVDQAEDRTPESERPAIVGEQALRGGVVEQDAALAIADDHRLCEFGHQRGQARAFVLEVGARRGHLGVEVPAERGVRLGESIHASRSVAQLRRALLGHAMLGIGRRDQARARRQSRGRSQRSFVEAPHEHAERTDERESEHEQQPDSRRRQHRAGGNAFLRREICRDHDQCRDDHRQRGAAEQCDRRNEAAAHSPSSSRTFAARSRVENGLVT